MTTTSPSSVRPKRGAAFRRVTAAGVAVVAVGAGLVSGTGAASAAEFDPYKDLSVYQVGPSLSSSLPAGDRTYQVGNDAFDVRGWARYGHLTVLDANGDQLCGPTFSSNGGGSESCTVPARELGRQMLIAAAKDDDGKILGQRDIRIEVFDKPNPGKPGGGDGGQTPEPVVAQPNPGVVDAGFSPFPTPEPVVANPNPGVTDPGFTPQPAAPSAPQKLEFEDASVAGNRVSVTLKGQAGDDVRISQNNKMLHAGKVTDDGRVRFEMFGTPGTQEFVQVIAERGGSSTSQVIWFDVPARAEAQPNPGVVDAGFSPFPTPEPVVANPNPGETDPGFTPQPPAPSAPQKLEFEDASVAGNRVSVTLKGQAGDDVRISQNNKMLHAGKVADDGRVRFEMFGTPGTQEFVQVIAERGGSSTSQVIWFDVPARAEAQPNPGVVDAGFSPFPTPEPVVANPNPGETDPGFTVQPGDDGEEQDVPGKGTITTTLVSSSLLADGTARLRFRDESAASPYSVEIWLDGKPREAATVTSSEYSPQDTFVRGFGAGHHVIEIRSNGVVIDTLEFDV